MTSVLLAWLSITHATAQNPIVPAGVYIADPSAHVWQDGLLYVYGSRDESTDYYCSWSYRVLVTADLRDWKLSEESFASRGAKDAVSYSDALLFAPDVQYRNGRFYLYYCMPDKQAEGVAVADSPLGPFHSGRPIYTRFNEIDPCVFLDDDGAAYLIWGQFNAKVARLKPGMTEIDTTTIRENLVTEKEHHFHEGAFMVKRNGIYYLLYADVSRAGKPTCIGYSTARSIDGPFTYRGVIVDNDNSDPVVWNNHGSMVEYKGNWYVFYHRPTNGSVTMRKACVEPIRFLADGTIPEVEMTSQGAGPPLNPYLETDAARACLLMGSIRIKTVATDNEVLGEIKHGDKAAFKYFNFASGARQVTLRVTPANRPMRVEVVLDNIWGRSAGSVAVPARGSSEPIVVTGDVDIPPGVHAVWLRFFDPAITPAYMDKAPPADSPVMQVDAFTFSNR